MYKTTGLEAGLKTQCQIKKQDKGWGCSLEQPIGRSKTFQPLSIFQSLPLAPLTVQSSREHMATQKYGLQGPSPSTQISVQGWPLRRNNSGLMTNLHVQGIEPCEIAEVQLKCFLIYKKGQVCMVQTNTSIYILHCI